MLLESTSPHLPPRNTLTSVILPSAKLLDSFDETRSLSIVDLREKIRDIRHKLEDMMANPIQFEADHPEMTIEEILDLYESFYFLDPIEEKWGRWGTWKCMCEDFMSGAICGHKSPHGSPV
jgi:hypothetical protein